MKPVESTLLGDKTGQHPPAARKPDAAGSDAPPKAAMPEPAPRDIPVQTSAPAPAQKVVVKKTGFWPVFLGGVVAAGLGSAATIWEHRSRVICTALRTATATSSYVASVPSRSR